MSERESFWIWLCASVIFSVALWMVSIFVVLCQIRDTLWDWDEERQPPAVEQIQEEN